MPRRPLEGLGAVGRPSACPIVHVHYQRWIFDWVKVEAKNARSRKEKIERKQKPIKQKCSLL